MRFLNFTTSFSLKFIIAAYLAFAFVGLGASIQATTSAETAAEAMISAASRHSLVRPFILEAIHVNGQRICFLPTVHDASDKDLDPEFHAWLSAFRPDIGIWESCDALTLDITAPDNNLLPPYLHPLQWRVASINALLDEERHKDCLFLPNEQTWAFPTSQATQGPLILFDSLNFILDHFRIPGIPEIRGDTFIELIQPTLLGFFRP